MALLGSAVAIELFGQKAHGRCTKAFSRLGLLPSCFRNEMDRFAYIWVGLCITLSTYYHSQRSTRYPKKKA